MKHKTTKQLLVILFFFALTLLSFFRLYTFLSSKDFQIRNSEETVFLLLSNGSYLEINPVNDVIDDQVTSFVKPFPQKVESSYEKITKFPFQTTKIAQTSANRKATLEKLGTNQVGIGISAKSDALVTENHFYYIQLDYSNRFSPTEGEDYIELSDNKCDLTIFKKEGYNYKVIDDKSVRVGVKYNPEINIEVNLDVDCNL